MKKVTGIILAVLLLTVCAFAFAEETAEPAQAPELFDLWDYGGESPVWAASATPVADGILLASSAVAEIPVEQLAVTDGVTTWDAKAVVQADDNLFALVFFDPSEHMSPNRTAEMMTDPMTSEEAYNVRICLG